MNLLPSFEHIHSIFNSLFLSFSFNGCCCDPRDFVLFLLGEKKELKLIKKCQYLLLKVSLSELYLSSCFLVPGLMVTWFVCTKVEK